MTALQPKVRRCFVGISRTRNLVTFGEDVAVLIDWLSQILGIGIIVTVLADVYLTVLYPRSGKSTLSLLLSKGVWELFRWLARQPLMPDKRLLSFCGPTLLILVVTFWICCLTLGFSLLFWPALGNGIQASQGETPTDFATAVYYSGFTVTTLGVGDLVPKTAIWRVITILEAALGFSVITATITYLLSVYSALNRRNTFALSLYHRSASAANAADILVRLKGFGHFELATQEITGITRDLLYLLESHHAYPVLHYFRFQEAQYSLARMALVSLDLVTLIKAALHPNIYQPLLSSSAVTELENGGLDLLYQVSESFLNERAMDQSSHKQDWRQWYFKATQILQEHGIETVDDLEAGADRYVALREQWHTIVVALAHYMDYRWSDIAPLESATESA